MICNKMTPGDDIQVTYRLLFQDSNICVIYIYVYIYTYIYIYIYIYAPQSN